MTSRGILECKRTLSLLEPREKSSDFSFPDTSVSSSLWTLKSLRVRQITRVPQSSISSQSPKHFESSKASESTTSSGSPLLFGLRLLDFERPLPAFSMTLSSPPVSSSLARQLRSSKCERTATISKTKMKTPAEKQVESVLSPAKEAMKLVETQLGSLLKDREEQNKTLKSRNNTLEKEIQRRNDSLAGVEEDLEDALAKAKYWEDTYRNTSQDYKKKIKGLEAQVEGLTAESGLCVSLEGKLKDKDIEIEELTAKVEELEGKLEARKRKWEVVMDVMESDDNVKKYIKREGENLRDNLRD